MFANQKEIASCNKAIDVIKNASNFNKWSISLVKKYIGDRILEIGGGIGTFTDFLLDKDLVVTTEIDDDCFNELYRKYSGINIVTVINDDILNEDFVKTMKSMNFDTVICFNVLEHIENDIEAIDNMKKCLGKEGYIILRVPAFNFLYSKLDKNVGHFRRYTKSSLSEILIHNNLEIVELFYMDMIGFIAWFLLFKIFQKESFASKNQIGIYDKFFVPVFSKLEKILKNPFGLTLFAVCKKNKEHIL